MSTPISPKVKAGINWGVIATLAVTILSTITPDMLEGLGVYAPLVYGAIGTGTAALAGFLKSDPLRDAGAAAATAAPSTQLADLQARIGDITVPTTPAAHRADE